MTSLLNWKLEQFRLTMFFEGEFPNVSGLWVDVVGAEPEYESSTRERGVRAFMAESQRGDGALQMRALPDSSRVDWLLGTVPSVSGSSSPSPIAGEIAPNKQEFEALIAAQVRAGLSPVRLAVGAVLLEEVVSKEAGYERLNNLLTGAKVIPGSSDFFYRINRPLESQATPGITLNRLSEWSVAQLLSMNLDQAESGAASVSEFMVRVGIDINTKPGAQVRLEADAQVALLNEMLQLALDVAKRGDA